LPLLWFCLFLIATKGRSCCGKTSRGFAPRGWLRIGAWGVRWTWARELSAPENGATGSGGKVAAARGGSLERRRAEVNLRMVLVKLFMGLMARADVRLQKTVIVRARPHSSEQVSAHHDPQAADRA